MALKSNPVTLGVTDTTIYQAPVDAGAVVQPYVSNVHATLTRTYTLKLFKQSTGVTTTLGAPSAPLAALAPLAKIPLAVSLEPGDRLIGLASAAASVVVTPFIDISRSSVAKGFNPRGDYAAGTTYAENDVVYLASTGSSYISIQDVNVGNSPDVSPAWWMVAAAQGAPGAAGVAGASALQIVRVMSSGAAVPASDFNGGDTIDGVVLVTNDLVFRNSASSPELNGVYVASAAGAASRHSEYASYNQHPGRVFSVTEGTAHADTLWQCTSNPGGVLGTNPLTFESTVRAAVAKTGDTMTGALVLPGNPTTALQAAPKQYVDARDARRNRVVNPAMQISQENGDSGGTTNGFYPVDQWSLAYITTGTVAAARAGLISANNSTYRIFMNISTADTSLTASEYCLFLTPIEGSAIADFGFGTSQAKSIILRFGWQSPAGTYSVALRNGLSNRAYVANFTISAGQAGLNTEQTIVIPGDTTGTWATDTGIGITLLFCIAAGTTYHTATPLTWQSGSAFATAANTNGLGTASASFYLSDVGLYLDFDGTGVPPRWEMPDPAVEKVRCQRYYQKHLGFFTHGYAATGFLIYSYLLLPVEMRIAGSLTISNQSYGNASAVAQNSVTQSSMKLQTTITTTGSGFALCDVVLNSRM